MSTQLGAVVRQKGPDAGVLVILGLTVVLCGAYVALSFVYGFEASDRLKLAGATVLALAGSFATWAQSRSRFVLYENGVSKRDFGGTLTLAFDDVTRIAVDRRSTKDPLHKDLITGKQDLQTTLTLSDGTRTIEFGEGSFGADAQLEAVAERVTTLVAKRMIATLDQTGTLALIPDVEFTNGKISGTVRGADLRGSGLVPPPIVVDSKILLLDADDASVCVRLSNAWAFLQQGETTLAIIPARAPNFFPVLEVLLARTNWTVLGLDADAVTARTVPPERFNTR